MKKRTDFESKIEHSGCERKGLRVVGVGYVPTPDANLRLSRALDILLRSARRDVAIPEEGTHAEEQEPHSQAPAEDALGGGSGGNNSHGEG